MTISPGWETDLAILKLSGSIVTELEDHVVIKTPSNPDYHWGNCILVLDQNLINDSDRWIAEYQKQFPENSWVAIGLPQMPLNTEDWEQQGVVLEQLDVLSTNQKPNQAELAKGYLSREFVESDWDLLVSKEIKDNIRDAEHDPAEFERFIRETNESRKRLTAQGNAQWFGVFQGEELVANLGIIRCGSTGRYQSVETKLAHRRKGLASHLLGLAAEWTEQRGCDRWVIVTEETNDAGRVYRAAGFTADIACVNAYRKPKP